MGQFHYSHKLSQLCGQRFVALVCLGFRELYHGKLALRIKKFVHLASRHGVSQKAVVRNPGRVPDRACLLLPVARIVPLGAPGQMGGLGNDPGIDHRPADSAHFPTAPVDNLRLLATGAGERAAELVRPARVRLEVTDLKNVSLQKVVAANGRPV